MFELLAFGIPGGPELLIILAILLFLFGAKQIPKLARGIGSGISEFKAGLQEGAETVREESASVEELVSETPSSRETADEPESRKEAS